MPQPFVETLALHATPRGLVLAVRRHLLLERGELCERRIRIGRTIALARRSARRILPVRWTAFPATAVASAAALVPSALTARIVAIAELGLVAILAPLAVEAIARPGIPVVPPLLTRGRPVGGGRNSATGRLLAARLIG